MPFGFAKVHGDGMVLAAAPKPAMVWGFCDPGAAVTVSLDGAAAIKATIGPDQATGTLTTWRVYVRPSSYHPELPLLARIPPRWAESKPFCLRVSKGSAFSPPETRLEFADFVLI